MLGSWVGISCFRRQALVTATTMVGISTIHTPQSIGKSVLYDLTDSSKKTAGALKKKPDGIRQNKALSKDSTRGRSRDLAGKGTIARSAATTPGFVKENRQTRIQSAKDPIQSLTSKMAEAKRKSLQAKDARDILVEKLKDGSLEPWQRRKIELRLKLKGEGWSPEKKLATSSMEKIRLLNAEFPEVWTMQRLSKQFKVSQEAIRRILKSKFQPSETQTLERETKRKAQIKEYKNSQLKRMQ